MAVPATVSAQKKKRKVKKEVTTDSGLKYEITYEGSGPQAQAGDVVVVHYTGKLTNDSIFDSSVKRGEPFSFKLGQGQVIQGWDEGISLLKVGDKAVLTIPPQLGYGERGVGPIPANSTLIFEVELLDIKQSPKPWEVNDIEPETTASGLKVYRYNKTEGKQAESGKMVSVHYSGYFEDGKMFDSSVERGQPITFQLGVGQVIKGWDEGIALLKVGEKAKFVIPYNLAYGEAGRPPAIPAKATLIFDVELMDVK